MHAPLEDEFGDIIRKARVGHAYTVEQVSSRTDVSASRLVGFESYELRPQQDEAEAIAGVLALSAPKLWDIAIDAYSPNPEPWKAESNASVEVIPADVGGYFENCYIVSCLETSKAIIFDPGGNIEAIADFVTRNNLVIVGVAITHGHADHTSGVSELAGRMAIRDLYIHRADSGALTSLAVNYLDDGDEFSIGTLAAQALHTPGHTAGSLCYRIGRLCVVGDTLFAGSVGKAMAGAASYPTLLASVRNKLLSLEAQTALLPGHGPATTVAEEIAHNPFF